MKALLLWAALSPAVFAGELRAPVTPVVDLPALPAAVVAAPRAVEAAALPAGTGAQALAPAGAETAQGASAAAASPSARLEALFDGAAPPRLDREGDLSRLSSEAFDVVVIGGGSVGAGTALDAASRGLKVALLEGGDYASGTSSRSTKLVHGGVRYLEAAVKNGDLGQYHLVKEALAERGRLLANAPHLSRPLAIFTPVYHWLALPYYYAGLKLYDWVAGRRSTLPGAKLLSRSRALALNPALETASLRGGVLYYDGQFDDARLNVALIQSARERGAAVANYAPVTGLQKKDGRVSGVTVTDSLSGKTFTVSGKVVVNAAGPFIDAIRRLDDAQAAAMLKASAGTHVVLPARFSPPGAGLLIPKTSDGRVLFVLPWHGKTLVGTTDEPAGVAADPRPTEAEIGYILETMGRYYAEKPTRADVLSVWTGLRPLVSDPAAQSTAELSRDHVIAESASGLITVAGGKWTTYRRIAEDAVDRAVASAGLRTATGSETARLHVAGAEGWNGARHAEAELVRDYPLDADVAAHLVEAYGTRARHVAKVAAAYDARLAPGHPYIEAEVYYAAYAESARTVADVLERRARLGFLDRKAELAAIPRVADILAQVLGWDAARRDAEVAAAKAQLSAAPLTQARPHAPLHSEKPRLTRKALIGLALMAGSYLHYFIYPYIAWLAAPLWARLALAGLVGALSWGLFVAGLAIGGRSAWAWFRSRF